MVDALQEARRVLTPGGVLLNVRPVTLPIIVEVVSDAHALWARQVEMYSAPEDVAAAEAAMGYALSCRWFACDRSVAFDFEIFCDTAGELRVYTEARKLRGAGIPYEELEERQRALASDGQTPRLRCRRPWMLSACHKVLPPDAGRRGL